MHTVRTSTLHIYATAIFADPGYEKVHPARSFQFPLREYGATKKRRRAFQHDWLTKFPWLHYDVQQDLAFCDLCVRATKQSKSIIYTSSASNTIQLQQLMVSW